MADETYLRSRKVPRPLRKPLVASKQERESERQVREYKKFHKKLDELAKAKEPEVLAKQNDLPPQHAPIGLTDPFTLESNRERRERDESVGSNHEWLSYP